ncbi:MAG: GntR family transcriptional regulator [Burkholderiales bacterium]|nr:MAG: GntR family transcriptional regulator [Burkholderiales bacterium]
MQAINTPTYMRLREQLRADIVDGLWPLGSHVTLAQLAKHYEVSQNPVREALLQLQGEGVVAMRMNRGAVIPQVDARYVDNLYRVRGAIQSMLAREAAQKVTAAQLEQLVQLERERLDAASRSDVALCVAANRDFHRYVDGIAENPLAVEMLEGRSALVDAVRRSRGYGQERLDLVAQQHASLIDAFARQDGERAARTSHEHTESSRLDLLSMLRPT